MDNIDELGTGFFVDTGTPIAIFFLKLLKLGINIAVVMLCYLTYQAQ
jgi:hypothetical protein